MKVIVPTICLQSTWASKAGKGQYEWKNENGCAMFTVNVIVPYKEDGEASFEC